MNLNEIKECFVPWPMLGLDDVTFISACGGENVLQGSMDE